MRNMDDDDIEGVLADAEDSLVLVDLIFEAMVAASEGNVQAAQWAVRQMTSSDHNYVQRLAAARTLAKVRPADYWACG